MQLVPVYRLKNVPNAKRIIYGKGGYSRSSLERNIHPYLTARELDRRIRQGRYIRETRSHEPT